MAGSSSFRTTAPPIPPTTTIRARQVVASQATTRSSRCLIHTVAVAAIITSPTSEPTVRWLYSRIAWYSNGGYQRPKHRGQSGQPSPEPVTRTTPPSVICSTSPTTATASSTNSTLSLHIGVGGAFLSFLSGLSGARFWARAGDSMVVRFRAEKYRPGLARHRRPVQIDRNGRHRHRGPATMVAQK